MRVFSIEASISNSSVYFYIASGFERAIAEPESFQVCFGVVRLGHVNLEEAV
jgi:hypothetical protein